jgi:hypothetical protein
MQDSVAPIVAPPAAPSPVVMHESVEQGPPPGPIPVEVQAAAPAPVVSETVAEAPQSRPQADSPPSAVEQHTTIEHINVLEVKPVEPVVSVIPPPSPVPLPIEQARTAPVVEKTTRETVLQEIIERIYATEPVPLARPMAKPAAGEARDRAVAAHSVEARPPEPRPQAPQPRVALRENGSRAIETTAPEQRTVNVRIGTVELKLSPPPAAAPPAPEPASGFDEFEEVRTYRF